MVGVMMMMDDGLSIGGRARWKVYPTRGFPKGKRKERLPNPPRLTPSDRNRSGTWNQGQLDTNTSGILCCIHNCASDSNRTFFGSYLGFTFLVFGTENPRYPAICHEVVGLRYLESAP